MSNFITLNESYNQVTPMIKVNNVAGGFGDNLGRSRILKPVELNLGVVGSNNYKTNERLDTLPASINQDLPNEIFDEEVKHASKSSNKNSSMNHILKSLRTP